MINKLMSLYKEAILFSEPPIKPSEQFYYFFDHTVHQWIGIPKINLTEKEVLLLKTLYDLVEFSSPAINGMNRKWYNFLFMDGELPVLRTDTIVRFIQFYIKNEYVDHSEIESALKGFFTDEVVIIWENSQNGIVIEESKQISLTESELTSISDTIESDLFVKMTFYFGKLYSVSSKLRGHFLQERHYFTFAKNHLAPASIINFEKVFPAMVADQLSETLKVKLSEIVELFKDDPELHVTIKVFLESNLNASMTAKNLYIHRNTLQYRIDKFIERTDIQLKDFNGAFTVFLACLLYEQTDA